MLPPRFLGLKVLEREAWPVGQASMTNAPWHLLGCLALGRVAEGPIVIKSLGQERPIPDNVDDAYIKLLVIDRGYQPVLEKASHIRNKMAQKSLEVT